VILTEDKHNLTLSIFLGKNILIISAKKHFVINIIYCEKQQPEKGFCVNSEGCQNQLVCLNHTCIGMYSLKNGSYLGQTGPKEACELGEASEIEPRRCIGLSYSNNTKEPNKDGFIECNYGDVCNYTTYLYDEFGDALPLEKRPCACGLNPDGKGYCPLSHDKNGQDVKDYYKFKAKLANNKCHTNNRGEGCYENFNQNADLYKLLRKKDAHLFYQSKQCVVSALTSSYLKLSAALVLVFISLLI